MSDKRDPAATRQIRQATLVIVAAILLWFGASALGGQLGLPVHYAFLFDLACMAALLWALIVLFRVWRSSQNNGV